MTASYAFASSSISASRRACVFFARPSSCPSSDSTLSYPFLPRARPATIRLSATDNAPARADTLPPPGVGVGAATAARNSSSVRSFIPQAGLQDLLAMEPSELEVLGRSVDEGIERHEADDFGLRDLDAFFCRTGANRFERLDKRRLAVIHHVHRDLHEPAVRKLEPFGPHGRQPSVALSDGLRDALRDADVRGPEVHV